MNFTRPFCENYGIALPNYVYKTPRHQIRRNKEFNKLNETLERLGESKIIRLLKTSTTTWRRCARFFTTLVCRFDFPSCDRTQSVYKEQKPCRESCLDVRHICRKIWEVFAKVTTIRRRKAKTKKLVKCELQPYRNAGDSPECWYDDFINSTGKF